LLERRSAERLVMERVLNSERLMQVSVR